MNKKIIHSVFESQAGATPDSIAIEAENSSVSYAELNRKANRLAHYLRQLAVRPNKDVIGCFFPAGISHVLSLLSVFKSGGIYLPLSSDLPQLRWNSIFNKINPVAILCDEQFLDQLLDVLKEQNIERLQLVIINTGQEYKGYEYVNGNVTVVNSIHANDENPELISEPDDINYIYHTSGSTGESKAIAGCHKSLSHFIFWEKREFGVDENFKVSQLTAITFDASLRDIFLPLCTGGTLCIPAAEVRNNPIQLSGWIAASGINLVHCVPSVLRSITKESATASDFSKLKYILVSGEMLYAQDIQNWRDYFGAHVEFVNLYGATETTLIKTFYRIKNNTEITTKVIPVGFPISNTVIIIANGDELCNPGEIGELYIKTPFTSKGYFGDEVLTGKVFIQNPINKENKDIVYRTGDLARYNVAGCIELVGRKDAQVKVNGIRIELGEIESALLNVKGIEKAVVTHTVNASYDSILSCYYTSDIPLNAEEIRKELLQFIPGSFLPSFYIQMDEFPLSINGKIDKRALPKPEELIYDKIEYKAPVSIIETGLCEIWSGVLGIKKIGINISFFQLGGNSLLAINMIGQVYKKWNVEIKLKDFFNHPSIEKLAEWITNAESGAYADIPVIAEQKHYQVSSAQKRLWILDQLEEGLTAYNITAPFILEGELNHDAFEKAINSIIERHESLRTVFKEENGSAIQLIKSSTNLNFKIEYEKVNEEGDAETLINRHTQIVAARTFDLQQGPLLRCKLLAIGKDKFIFILSMHHIISDGVSVGIFIKELLLFYNSYLLKDQRIPEQLRIQYKDYSGWQTDQAKEDSFRSHKKYWKEQFAGTLPVLELRTDYSRPKIKTYKGAVVETFIDEDTTALLNSFAKRQDCTLFMLLLAGVNALMARYTGQTDIVIGTPVAGRTHNDLKEQIGFYANTLALRIQFSKEDSFIGLLKNTRNVILNGFDHQVYPFDELVEDLDLQRDRSRSVLFDIMVVLQNASMKKEALPGIQGLNAIPYNIANDQTKFDLTFNFAENENGMSLLIEYNTDLYCKARISNMCMHLKNILSAAVENTDQKIIDLEYISFEEKQKLIVTNNDTYKALDYKTVVELIEQQAALNPDKTAIAFEGKNVSYKKLNERANRLSHHLTDIYKIQPGDVVGILMERSDEMVVAFLAVMKSGAAYLPMAPDYPDDRITWIMENSGAKAIVKDVKRITNCDSLSIDPTDKKIQESPARNPLAKNSISDTAYIIYTSGSTGNPKGVLISYEGLYNRILWQWEVLGFTTDDVIAQKTSNTFDVSVWEFFMPLCFGAKMVVCPLEAVHDHYRFIELIEREKITAMHFVPTVYNSFLQVIDEQVDNKLSSLKRVITSGEALLPNTVKIHYGKVKNAQLINLYGPTEASIDVSCYITEENDITVPIGKPVWNTQLYVLDDKHRPVAEGIPGELYISGVQLAKGYLNNKQLTEERFIDNPFRKEERMYKTGDLCCWTYDATIEYIGRLDDQVKISGHRIEPGEIESQLVKFDEIRSAVVLAKKNKTSEKVLIAYYEADAEIDPAEMRAHLKETLPDYMVPAFFVWLKNFPLTTSAKVDKKALPDHKEQAIYASYEAPATATEKALQEIWGNVLGYAPAGINDDFFDAGGHSLKAMQIIAQLYNSLHVRVQIRLVFNNSSIRKLAGVIDSLKRDNGLRISPVAKQDTYPLSHAQKRLWIIDQMEGGNSSAYNVSGAFLLKGELNIKAFDLSLRYIVARHEILRTTFAAVNDEPRQIITEDAAFKTEILDLSNAAAPLSEVEALLVNESRVLFDLKKDLLIRTKLIKISKDTHVFVLTMHHIVSDGWAMQLFLKELFTLYSDYLNAKPVSLQPLTLQYKDYAVWQLENKKQHEDYWIGKLKGKTEYVNFQYDYPRQQYNAFKGSIESITIGKDAALLLNKLAKDNRTSLSTLMFTIFTLLLNKLTGQDAISVGMTVANRDSEETQNLLGLFVNTIVIRVDFPEDLSFTELLSRQTKEIIEAFEYQAYPFDMLVDQLKPDRQSNYQPLINVAYTFHNQKDLNISRELITETANGESVKINDLEIDYFGNEELVRKTNVTSKYDMLMLVTAEDEINVALEFNTDLFRNDTIKNYLSFFSGIIDQLIK